MGLLGKAKYALQATALSIIKRYGIVDCPFQAHFKVWRENLTHFKSGTFLFLYQLLIRYWNTVVSLNCGILRKRIYFLSRVKNHARHCVFVVLVYFRLGSCFQAEYMVIAMTQHDKQFSFRVSVVLKLIRERYDCIACDRAWVKCRQSGGRPQKFWRFPTLTPWPPQ